MNFQEHCKQYIQKINQTRSSSDATPELSLHSHLHEFLEYVTTDADCFDKPEITFTLEPKTIVKIGRPDFIAKEGMLPIGYIEAEKYGIDLNNLTGHAKEQNERFKENLDNFVLTNFVDFQRSQHSPVMISQICTHKPSRMDCTPHAAHSRMQPIFHDTAYQVSEKWLKDRKNKEVNYDDIKQYRSILVAIAETLHVVGEIDRVLEF